MIAERARQVERSGQRYHEYSDDHPLAPRGEQAHSSEQQRVQRDADARDQPRDVLDQHREPDKHPGRRGKAVTPPVAVEQAEQREAIGGAEQRQYRVIVAVAPGMEAVERRRGSSQHRRPVSGCSRSRHPPHEPEQQQHRRERRERRRHSQSERVETEQLERTRHQHDHQRRLGVPQVGLEIVGGDQLLAADRHLRGVHCEPRLVPLLRRYRREVAEEEQPEREHRCREPGLLPSAKLHGVPLDCGGDLRSPGAAGSRLTVRWL